jgi:hypothetical protein
MTPDWSPDDSQVSPFGLRARFSDRISDLTLWASLASSRARDMSFEWLAASMALAVIDILFVIAPAGVLRLLDVATVIGILGAGFSLARFEFRSHVILRDMAKQLDEQMQHFSITEPGAP